MKNDLHSISFLMVKSISFYLDSLRKQSQQKLNRDTQKQKRNTRCSAIMLKVIEIKETEIMAFYGFKMLGMDGKNTLLQKKNNFGTQGGVRGIKGGLRVNKVMDSQFFQNFNCMSNVLGFFGLES